MPTPKEDISDWFDAGVQKGAKYMIVICDSFAYEDYPSYTNTEEQCLKIYLNPGEMQRVMEVYDLNYDKTEQLNCQRNMRIPILRGNDMTNEKQENTDVPLTEKQIDKIINDLTNRYGPDEQLPLGEIEYFLRQVNLGE